MSTDGTTRLLPLVPEPATKGRGRGRKSAGGVENRQVSVAHHPRIASRVGAAKAWGALVAFALVALASSKAGAESFDVLSRALVAGVVGWIVTWAAAVAVGRNLVRAEVEAHRRALDGDGDDETDS